MTSNDRYTSSYTHRYTAYVKLYTVTFYKNKKDKFGRSWNTNVEFLVQANNSDSAREKALAVLRLKEIKPSDSLYVSEGVKASVYVSEVDSPNTWSFTGVKVYDNENNREVEA